MQFGHGRLQKRIQATVTSETRHIAVEIASDKEETNRILSDLGLPVPRQMTVKDEESAVRAARKLGHPVVVKPLDANHGRGVSIHLNDDEAIRTAFRQAQEHSRTVIVETFITGFDHRMLVVDGELIAVAKRVPGHVVGDGVRTVEQLVEAVNADPRRGIGHEKVLTRLEFDHQAERLLAKKGWTRQSVPPADEVVYLRSTGNLSTGGTSVDVTDLVHPDNRFIAVRSGETVLDAALREGPVVAGAEQRNDAVGVVAVGAGVELEHLGAVVDAVDHLLAVAQHVDDVVGGKSLEAAGPPRPPAADAAALPIAQLLAQLVHRQGMQSGDVRHVAWSFEAVAATRPHPASGTSGLRERSALP